MMGQHEPYSCLQYDRVKILKGSNDLNVIGNSVDCMMHVYIKTHLGWQFDPQRTEMIKTLNRKYKKTLELTGMLPMY